MLTAESKWREYGCPNNSVDFPITKQFHSWIYTQNNQGLIYIMYIKRMVTADLCSQKVIQLKYTSIEYKNIFIQLINDHQ